MSDMSIVQGWLPGDKRPYTYALLLPEGRVFYYGKGTGKRILCHRLEAQSGKFINRHKNHTILKLWASAQDYQEIILAYHATEEEAFMHEIALIFLSGDRLTNLTIGGQGSSNREFSPEARRKIGEANKNRVISVETRRKISELKQNMSPETRRKIGEARKNASPETRRKVGEASKGNRSRKGMAVSPETRRKISETERATKQARREQAR
jgi:hypothetical protein